MLSVSETGVTPFGSLLELEKLIKLIKEEFILSITGNCFLFLIEGSEGRDDTKE